MHIKSLYFKNSFLGWEIAPIEFEQLNLLVGLSGAGKTQILKAIWHLRGIALGKTMNDVEWKIAFSNEDMDFEWSGAFGSPEMGSLNDERYPILFEAIKTSSSGHSIERAEDGTLIINDPESNLINARTPRSAAGSGLIFNLYGEEHPFVAKAISGFKKMVFRDHTLPQSDPRLEFYDLRFRYDRDKYDTLTIDDLKKRGYTTMERLLIAKMNKLEVVQEISDRFKDVFPEISEIRFNEIRTQGQNKGHIEYQIKPKKSRKWVPHWNISSGMLRILNYLIEAYLADEDTVFLIDEFENSLGHNCLPFLADDILNRSISQQFIMTSHHPDIINAFEMNSWLVISRSNGRIQNTRPETLPLGRTKHVPYLALMNYFETTSS